MQAYIRAHAADETVCMDGLYGAAGYSKRHADRIFKELTGRTPQEYIRAVRLSASAETLLDPDRSVLDTALASEYQTHEGFTRAFKSAFGVAPSRYQREHTPIPLFVQYPVDAYYAHLYQKEEPVMKKETFLCMVTPVQRPKRKLLLLRSRRATGYWDYCEEVGCDWNGLFNSIPEKFDTAAILTLPAFLQKEGYSAVASGVEFPLGYGGGVPDGCELAELEACEMLYFQSAPFEDESAYGEAIGGVFEALERYEPEQFGYAFAYAAAPAFNFGACAEKGAKLAVPVRRIR